MAENLVRHVLLATGLALAFAVAPYRGISATENGEQHTSDVEKLAAQIRDLQRQLAESPRIVAAGTATWQLGPVQNNSTSVRVQLKDEIASRLGEDYIVILTNRNAGYPYYSPYWRKSKNGFEITLIDPNLAPGATVSYLFSVNRTYQVDWIVVKK
jgi:hypothetical protein